MADFSFKDMILASANRTCEHFLIAKDSITLEDAGSMIYCAFGTVEKDSFCVSIDIFTYDSSLSRIIVSAGKNAQGRHIYNESREPHLLERFLFHNEDFCSWLRSDLERLERKFG